MTYLLDTNACIALINGRPETVRQRFARVSAGDDVIATSSVVLFELWYGVAKSQRLKANAEPIATFLSGPLEGYGLHRRRRGAFWPGSRSP
ncbi:MAG: PIN domain-containing protein [Candidatus Dormibacteraeota bacterium]|nr:PIN domain-containing protein [Candidatus Dormibacteraeota bacterium]